MKSKFKILALSAFFTIGAISACSDDDEPLPDVNEEELITTLQLRFTNTADAADVRTFTAKDLDGDGGAAPVVSPVNLAANKTYNLEVTQLLNETSSPADNILEEVKEESADHLFVFKPTGNLTITATDKDANNLAIGVNNTAVTGAAGSGNLRVILKHQPGTKNGTEAPGTTDADFTFNMVIQ